MKTFKQYLEENKLATFAAATALASGAMAAPPKPEALDILLGHTKQKEGFRPVAEPDKDTIEKPVVVGYGTTYTYPDTGKPIKLGDTVTKEKAEELVRASYKRMTPHMEKIPGWDEMNAGQQAGLMSFAYNVGPGFYGKKGYETISSKLRDRKWDEVPQAMSIYNRAGGKVLRGLVKRRAEEAEMWKSGSSQPQPQPQPQQTATPTQQSGNVHTVVKGDILGKIAEKNKMSVQDLLKLNPDIKDPNRIYPGQNIKTK